jgi:hypothetical protein
VPTHQRQPCSSVRSHHSSRTLSKSATDPVISTLLLAGCCAWLDHGFTTITACTPADHPFPELLDRAINKQNAIGWHQIFCGCLSLAWGFCYIHEMAISPPPHQEICTPGPQHLDNRYHQMGHVHSFSSLEKPERPNLHDLRRT